MPAWLIPLQETVSKWSEHKDARLGAALAYYSVFSLGPLILIAIAIAGLVFGAEAVQGQVLGTLKRHTRCQFAAPATVLEQSDASAVNARSGDNK